MKINPVGAKLFHVDGYIETDRQTDRDKQTNRHDEEIFGFCNLANARKNIVWYKCLITSRFLASLCGAVWDSSY
jgi:hypothetical protein